MRNIFIICLISLSFQVFAQVPNELQGYWQFKVDKPGDWNGFEVGQNYIEGFYTVYAIRQIDTDNNGKIRIALEGPDNVIYEFLDAEGSSRRVKISSRKDTLLCTRFENDPDIDYLSIDEAPVGNTRWRNAKNLDEPLVFDSNKITIGNESWHVKWFGKYKFNEEYRALGEKDGEHRLFYVSPQTNSLKLVYNMKASYFTKEGEFPEIYAFLGNWYHSATNEWNYGFFETSLSLTENLISIKL